MPKPTVLLTAITASLVLCGCPAAVVPLIAAEAVAVGAGLKLVQTTTGGSVEISVDVSKVTDEQKAQVKNIKSLAVWPESSGAAVTFAEALSEGGRFAVISPSRVASVLKKSDLSDDLKLMTNLEARDAFAKVCAAVNADAVVYTRMTATNKTMNIWSFDRANVTTEYLTSIYARSTNSAIVSIPVKLKVLIGENRPPSSEEISNLANTELARNILALATGQAKTEQLASRAPQEPPKQEKPRETEKDKLGGFLDGLSNSVKGLFGK